jgi:methylenetetrahydrofolate dehydrogenase (NADP+)/methenyltetrahydrofolate cyclohydrolase
MKTFLNGKKESEKIAMFLEESERLLGKSLIIIQCDGHVEESMYVRLKREMGERLGVMVSVLFAKNIDEVEEFVSDANGDDTVDGILVQLPILGADIDKIDQILCSINPAKDIDGLNPKSRFIPAVVRAVERAMEIFKISKTERVVVVGSLGEVGKRLVKRLISLGFDVTGFDKGDNLHELKKFDVVIGATGVDGLVKGNFVSDGVTAIDLGYPKGDFSPEALEKAEKITPVPNGVGPLTIVSLFESLAEV